MLKRLTMVGFKSFADRTDFDFAAGLTGIVGPNGSGKSNIVDAVKWVLGEQSAKSLRGGEMADVIFNGSASRKSVGLAEVIMTFDNSRRDLATEAEEVQIGRRVYRSGESEYLINGQVCRLKDVKNLFLGSGAGTDAYSIIEQGRVDVLLQASTRERRTIFEEAAGISRFKAKKTETLRRLERVDQNVQRLRDILDEVEKQLRSVKLQAAKAQRYREYSDRLRELRVGLGLMEYHDLQTRLVAEQAVLDKLRTELQDQSVQADAWEQDAAKLELALRQLDEAVRAQESLLGAARERIATAEATLGHEKSLTTDLEADLTQGRERLAELSDRVSRLTESAEAAAEELRQCEGECREQRSGVERLEAELEAALERIAELHDQADADKNAHLEQMRHAARLQNDVVSVKAHVDNLVRERDRLRQRSEQAATHLASIDLELQELTAADENLQARLTQARQSVAGQRQERERLRELHEEASQNVSDLRAQRSGLASRIEVLEGLERSQEGLGTGVREVVTLVERSGDEPWGSVLGMVADFLQVRREYAPLIDLALGETAQSFLVRDEAALDRALRSGPRFSGRVGFVVLAPEVERPAYRTDDDFSPGPVATANLRRVKMPPLPEGAAVHPGLIAFAERLATCDEPDLVDLPSQLLGRTLVVRDLMTARAIAEQMPGHRFVTLQGEVLEADGSLTVGTHHAEAGILSRKSELRELREQIGQLDRRIADLELDLVDLRDRMGRLDQQAEQSQQEVDVLAEQAADLRSRIGQHRQRREGLHEEVQLSQSEMENLEAEIERNEEQWEQARDEATTAEAQVQELQSRLDAANQEAREREERRQRQQEEWTTAKVALGKAEERLAGLEARQQQLEADLTQRKQERTQLEARQTAAQTRLEESQRTVRDAAAMQAEATREKEAAEQKLTELEAERGAVRTERQSLQEKMQTVRGAWRSQQEEAHTRELQVNDLAHRRNTLIERLREDYQLDLAELYQQRSNQPLATPEEDPQDKTEDTPAADAPPASPESPAAAPFDPAAANEEIAELKRKLSRLGSVNLDSLEELNELETRAATLQAQFDDLSAARKALEDIINRINTDSRRLFMDTFATIRTHFQELFRKLFGGGQADIVLEDENDVLDTGIEVIARPPGKELRSISLMSGGEKTMTAVGLLLAIFRSKPSPFCILDEVDAALDEANIGRFTAVLREFLDRSQFIIITHSKRTMSCADVLYGITMQESGISKRVAVRFEDWPDDGSAPPKEAPSLGSFGGK